MTLKTERKKNQEIVTVNNSISVGKIKSGTE